MDCKISSDNNIQKRGNTREELFHVWRSFHYDESTETLDTYVTRIRQVAAY